ncbi:MAG: NAD(P)H-binding protein [Actinomycetota bacterium]|nr:NAD(P)H-binding protein [Actinomycetota bacterium]
MRDGKILVVGATGRVGGAAIEQLPKAGFEVRVLVRRAEKGERLRSLGAEVAVGDVTAPETLEPAVQGCSGVFSALGAGPGRGAPEMVEYRGNLNLLSAARSAGVGRFVYSSVHLADHPLAQKVGAFREKARFERELLTVEDVSSTILRPAIFMETLDMMIQGPVAFVPGRQRRPVSFIAARDIARAAVRAFQADLQGRYELAGPESLTLDDAFEHLGRGRRKGIRVLHVPLIAMRLYGRTSPYARELANMMAFFDAVGFAADPAVLRDAFGISALTIEQWASQGWQPGND